MTLLELILQDFGELLETDPEYNRILKKIEDGTATYSDAQDLAVAIGEVLGDVYGQENIEAILEEGIEILRQPLTEEYRQVSEATARIQKAVNENAGINLNAVVPDQNVDRIEGLYQALQSERFEDPMKLLQEACVNYAQSIVDNSAKANAAAQFRAGMSPKIVRTIAGGCCDWCANLAGTYEYVDVRATGNDVFRRHRYCRCKTLYIADGTVQDAHSKQMVSRKEAEARIETSEKKRRENRIQAKEITAVAQNREERQLLLEKQARDGRIKLIEMLETSISRPHFRTGGMNPEDYAAAKEMWNRVAELNLPQKEKEWVYQEFDNNLTEEEKRSPIVCRPLGDYYYHAVNKGHNQYKIFKKIPIDPYTDWLDEIMSEIFGRNWRNFDT